MKFEKVNVTVEKGVLYIDDYDEDEQLAVFYAVSDDNEEFKQTLINHAYMAKVDTKSYMRGVVNKAFQKEPDIAESVLDTIVDVALDCYYKQLKDELDELLENS